MEDHRQQQQLRLKCIVLGSANAGKTCLLRRYIHNKFEGGTTTNHTNNKEQSIRRKRSTTSTQGADYYVKKVDNSNTTNHPDVFVQLWDTAGKERLQISPNTAAKDYRRSSNFYQFLSIRPSSKSSITGSSSSAYDYKSSSNCNNYEHRYNNWNAANDDRTSGGRQRRRRVEKQSSNELQNNTQTKHSIPASKVSSTGGSYHNTPAEDALFKNIDACMLVYDATSSMSFLHLMQWHSEWIERLKYWDKEDDESKKNKRRVRNKRKIIPFIVVANKIDLLKSKMDTAKSDTASSGKASHRSVMGLRNDEYEGKQLKYEYAAEEEANNTTSTTSSPSKERPSPLTYSLKETQWSTDQTYLNALQHTEDELPANRQMILLWCKRNGIPHVEASALTGEGVNEAMKQLIDAGVDELKKNCEIDESGELVEDMSDQESEEEVIIPQNTTLSEEVDDGIVHHHQQQQEQHTDGDVTLDHYDIEYHQQQIDGQAIHTPQLNGDTNGSVAREEEAAVVDPSQYYFVYQPRKEEDSLDLFARYSPKEEERLCSPFKCWMTFFSYCRL